jgi:hypothetical protein
MTDGSGWESLARGLSRKEFLKLGGAGLVVATGLLGVAGCGGNSSGKVTLRYGIWDQAQMPAMEDIVEEFSRANPDISVEIELTPYEEYLSKLQNAAQGGTGSITYGERLGHGVRVGGRGDLFGDEGSAYWISIKGLNAFTRMSDGRLPVGPLHEALRTHLELAADLDLVDVVLNRWQGGRSEIAALSRIVAKAAETGDECAAQILSEAADELAKLVDTTRRILDFGREEKVPVSYSGGIFSVRSIVDGFEGALEDLHDGYELRKPLYSPVIGAAIYAARLAGEPLGTETLRHLEASM